MKKAIWLVASLTAISAACAGVLAYIDDITREPIEKSKTANTLRAAADVMPSGVEKVEASGEGAFLGLDASGQVIGYAVQGADAGGYGGEVVLMVGFRADRKTVVAYKTLAASETPGLGMNLKSPDFAGQFADKDGTSLKVKKDGGEIEAITAATITSRAVCRAIASAAAKAAAL